MEKNLFDEITKVDSRCQAMGITLENLKTALSQIEFAPNLPTEIKEHSEICKKLYLYSYFVYEFATIAQQKTYLMIEAALKEKLRLYYPGGFDFKNRTSKEVELHKPHSLSSFHSLLNQDELTFCKKDGYFEQGMSLKSLLDWLVGKGLCPEMFLEKVDLWRSLRNYTAHPIGVTILPVGVSLAHFKKVIEFLNKLYA